MHSPRQSLGESRMHPSTPCSASTECGGRRSILGVPAVEEDLRRDFFKSADTAPDSGRAESIMASRRLLGTVFRHSYLLEVLPKMSSSYSPSCVFGLHK